MLIYLEECYCLFGERNGSGQNFWLEYLTISFLKPDLQIKMTNQQQRSLILIHKVILKSHACLLLQRQNDEPIAGCDTKWTQDERRNSMIYLCIMACLNFAGISQGTTQFHKKSRKGLLHSKWDPFFFGEKLSISLSNASPSEIPDRSQIESLAPREGCGGNNGSENGEEGRSVLSSRRGGRPYISMGCSPLVWRC
jgi:hypothetical protein